MFVPLPVPFVFQRATPDLNAWRLKSPLALRSNSGKTFFLFSLLHLLHVGQAAETRPACLARCRCTCSGQSWRRTHPLAHAHTHTPRAPSEGLNTVLRTCGAAVKNQRSCPGRFALSRLIENELRKMSRFFSLSVL